MAPVWLAFNNTGFNAASLPSLNTPLTTLGAFYIAHCTPNMGNTSGTSNGLAPVTQFQIFTGTSSSSSGLLLASGGSGSVWNQQVSILPTIISIPGFTPKTNTPYSSPGGCHIYGYSINSPNDNLDHFTVDGVEVASYANHGTSAANATITGGTYQIGVDPFGNGLRGVVSYAIYYPASHTIAQMQAVSQYIQAKLNQRPTFPKYPVLSNSTSPQLVFAGDSLTAGYQGTSAWTAAVTPNVSYTVSNYGVAGVAALDTCQLYAQRWAQQIVPGQTTIFFWAGINDAVFSATASEAWLALSACASRAKSFGARTVVSTLISFTGQDAYKNSFNALARSQYKAAGFDYLVDMAETPLGADGANTNAACFNADHKHLVGPGAGTCGTVGSTALTGYGIVAAVDSGVINTLDGSSKEIPDTSVSDAFVSTYANNFLIQTPSAAATYSLVDCQGQTSPRTIVNGSGSFAITVSAINSQTIKGSTSIAANTIGVFMPVLTSPTAAGCSWVRTQ